MPLTHIKYISFLFVFLCASLSWAQDDYDFTDPEPAPTGTDSGDDFTFDEPIDAADTGNAPANTGGNSNQNIPSFLQNSGDDETNQAPVVTAADIALAKEADKKRIWVLQRRPFLKRKRFELRPIFGTNINDPLVTYYSMGADLNYHLNEQFAIGVRGNYTLNSESDEFDKIVNDYSVFPKVSRPIWSGSLHLEYAPVYGKLVLFKSWIFPWEIYTRAGVGALQTFVDTHVVITAGGGQRFFINRWFTFNIDVDYQLFQENFSESEQVLLNNLVFSVGFSIFFPLDYEYRELK